ncbi:DNA-processing protein DprA [Cellulosilyticum sp. I15G10I2]|uniref:DNA-processing protein DprA n=1 Tax=Cellulosilyticum sp. I15G10I2 TaxID=1892843 RepID=UPI00085C9EC4|nr:DNA-processing protein DprA [Cellulosilyticum sp. I15G10I2]
MDKKYSMWLHKLSIPEYIKVKMIERFRSYKKIYEANATDYQQFNLENKQILKIEHSKETLEDLSKMIKVYEDQKIHIVDILDNHYPYYLKQISDPPIILFIKGDLNFLNQPTLGIVGSRKCSEYGFETTYRLAKELAEQGVVVISGMAYGIDEAAHKGALKTGHTIAVMGTGINICYPSQNQDIYHLIAQKGCVISEYDLDTPPLPYQFPKRNRIISGMSMGILVVEADIKSGSLITANLALEHNRDVFAIPGNINSKLSSGTNELIRNGAKCVTKIDDIIEEFPLYIKTKMGTLQKNTLKNDNCKLAQDESIVYAYLSQSPINLNELFKNTELPYEIVYPSLIKLEIKGLIKRLPGERYVRV